MARAGRVPLEAWNRALTAYVREAIAAGCDDISEPAIPELRAKLDIIDGMWGPVNALLQRKAERLRQKARKTPDDAITEHGLEALLRGIPPMRQHRV